MTDESLLDSPTSEKSHSIFKEQISRKPDFYPWTEQFITAMHNGHWTDKEFNFKSDLHQFKVVLTDKEREAIVRTLSAIGQIEVAVKTFWAKLGDNLPHPSLQDLGYVMANIEVIHNNAYERLLKVLDLEDIFEENLKLDWIQGRVKYLRKYTHKFYKDSRKQYLYAIILFTLFVENVSLFSQFYIINWFARFQNVLKDTDQQVKYTRNEECYAENTEIMTPKGWRQLSDVKEGDEVFQYNNQDRTFSVVNVLHTTKKHFEGEMISFKGNGYSCLVTPDHDMIYFDDEREFFKIKAKDLKMKKDVFIPVTGMSDKSGSELSHRERLLLAVHLKGDSLIKNYNNDEEPVVSWHKSYLSKIISNYVASNPDDARLSISNVTNESILESLENKDSSSLNWVKISSDTSKWWYHSFIEEIIKWNEGKDGVFYSSEKKENIDIVQMIAILAGYKTTISEDYKSVKFEKTRSIISANELQKTEVPYSGNVYCVTVPSGNILTRLDGQTFIAGNCLHALVGIKIVNTIREEHPELFDEELQNRILHEAKEAFVAEGKIVDWMVNGIDEENLNAEILKEFIKKRINDSLTAIGFNQVFDVDSELIKKTAWFDEELLGNNMTDFFHSKSTEYVKKNTSFDEDDLF